MEILSVDLQAEGELMPAPSLLGDQEFGYENPGNGGADFVHLIAANELSIDNLRFSEQVREIAMQAMTINIWSVNFPAGSTVNAIHCMAVLTEVPELQFSGLRTSQFHRKRKVQRKLDQ